MHNNNIIVTTPPSPPFSITTLPYLDKDQLGGYTMLSGDIVLFSLAVDRRNGDQRATNVQVHKLIEEQKDQNAREMVCLHSHLHAHTLLVRTLSMQSPLVCVCTVPRWDFTTMHQLVPIIILSTVSNKLRFVFNLESSPNLLCTGCNSSTERWVWFHPLCTERHENVLPL